MTSQQTAALFIATMGLVGTLATRPLWNFQLRMAEWQLNWMRKHASAYIIVFRLIGLTFVVSGITLFFQH